MTAIRVFLVLFSLLSLVLNIAGQICTPDALGATAVYGATSFTALGSLTTAMGVHIERATGTNQGKVWVVTGNTVARYTNAYSLVSVSAPEYSLVATNGGGTVTITNPTFFTTDSAGTCYLSDTGNHRVLIFGACYSITSATANPTGVLGQTTLATGTVGAASGTSVNTPEGIGLDTTVTTAISATNPLFVVNRGFSEVIKFTTVTTTCTSTTCPSVFSFGTGTAAGGTANVDLSTTPSGMAFSLTANAMWIADTGNNRIMTVTGAIASTTGTTGVPLGTTAGCANNLLKSPSGVSYDPASNILYIADTSNFRVVHASATATGVLSTTLTGVMFPAGAVVGTCATTGSTAQNAANLPFDVDAVPAGSLAPTAAGGPTLIFSDQNNARLVKLCSGTVSGSITTTQAVASVSASLSVSAGSAVSQSLSASVGSAGISSSLSTSFGSAAGTSPSFSASAAAASASISITVSFTATASFSLTVSITTSLTTSITTSITNSFTNSNSNSLSITNSVTNSYTNSVTNSNTNSYSNSYTNSHSISISRSIRLCGNGKIDGAEKCDDGTGNGKIHGCCRRNCRFKYGGHICKAPLGVQCYGKGRCDRSGKCRDLKIKAGKRCNVAGNVSGVKDGRCNINAVCTASA